jgi:hypothetical protein
VQNGLGHKVERKRNCSKSSTDLRLAQLMKKLEIMLNFYTARSMLNANQIRVNLQALKLPLE